MENWLLPNFSLTKIFKYFQNISISEITFIFSYTFSEYIFNETCAFYNVVHIV